MKFNHCTIDLETMDNRPTAAITSIGCVMFDENGNRDEFYTNVDLESGIKLGMTVKGETIMWWMAQDKAAQKALLDPKPIDVTIALHMLAAFIVSRKDKDFTCWTHATFDAPIINNAYSLIGVNANDMPIHYRQHRDIRTLSWLCRTSAPKNPMPKGMVAHDALSDARHQANYISDYLVKLGKFKDTVQQFPPLVPYDQLLAEHIRLTVPATIKSGVFSPEDTTGVTLTSEPTPATFDFQEEPK